MNSFPLCYLVQYIPSIVIQQMWPTDSKVHDQTLFGFSYEPKQRTSRVSLFYLRSHLLACGVHVQLRGAKGCSSSILFPSLSYLRVWLLSIQRCMRHCACHEQNTNTEAKVGYTRRTLTDYFEYFNTMIG